MPQPFLGFLPSESSPRRNRAPLSGPHAPLPLSTDVLRRDDQGLLTAGFADSRAVRRSCLVPPATMRSLSTHPRARFPVPLDPERRNRLVPPASPTSKPSSSCESVRAGTSRPEPTADPLLGFCPSRAFAPHASDPRTHPRPGAWIRAFVRRLQRAASGTSRPQGRVSSPQHGCTGTFSRRRPDPLRGQTEPSLDGPPSPMALSARRTWLPDLRSLGIRERRRFSAEIACSFGVSCLLANLAASSPPPARALTSRVWRPSPTASPSLWTLGSSS